MLIQCINCLDILDTTKYSQQCKCFSNTESNTGVYVDSMGEDMCTMIGRQNAYLLEGD